MELVALVASIALPLWNIPLIVKIVQRRSSEDISLAWALGVWGCILLMAPAGFTSDDLVWRTFNMVNAVFFTAVVITVLSYRFKKKVVH
ncbi:MAG: hypothetical protein LR011_07000 [Verrucomicrobia bacterium]|nr:hypothetical protein [Verrucomicrobiota bacterium]